MSWPHRPIDILHAHIWNVVRCTSQARAQRAARLRTLQSKEKMVMKHYYGIFLRFSLSSARWPKQISRWSREGSVQQASQRLVWPRLPIRIASSCWRRLRCAGAVQEEDPLTMEAWWNWSRGACWQQRTARTRIFFSSASCTLSFANCKHKETSIVILIGE